MCRTSTPVRLLARTHTHTFIPTQMDHVKVNPGRIFQVMFVHLHSSPWHPVFRGQGMSSNFECLVLVKRLFIPSRRHTDAHTATHTHTHACTATHMHTHAKPTQHMAHRYSLPCKALHLIGSQSLLRSLHAESPYTIKRTSKGRGKTAHAHTNRNHTSFNPRCLRESERNGEAEHNS